MCTPYILTEEEKCVHLTSKFSRFGGISVFIKVGCYYTFDKPNLAKKNWDKKARTFYYVVCLPVMPADSGMAEKLSPVLREFLVPDPGIKLFKKRFYRTRRVRYRSGDLGEDRTT